MGRGALGALRPGGGGGLMADGKTHAHYAGIAATAVTVGAGVLAVAVHPVFLAAPVGAWAGYIAGPDLDHHVHTEDEQRIWRYNRLLGRLWSLYWTPYEWANPHRGRSHTIPDGTMDRFLLLLWPLLMLSLLAVPTAGAWVAVAWGVAFVAQMMVDAVHLWLDGLL